MRMKILYISSENRKTDYLCDAVLHGLKSLLGDEVVDVGRAWFLYRNDCLARREELSSFHGRGFSLYGLLPEDVGTDRSDINAKIRSRFFDLIVYGSIARCHDYWELVRRHYPAEKIVFLDGEDWGDILPGFFRKGRYYKRELQSKNPLIFPVSFSIPQEKIRPLRKDKEGDFSPLVPKGLCHKHNIKFLDETEYYDHYSAYRYALTWRKGGWDCLRHYEILAAGCVPYFVDLANCPSRTLFMFPKELCLKTMSLPGVCGWMPRAGYDQPVSVNHGAFDAAQYEEHLYALQRHLHNHLTTERVAAKLIESIALKKRTYHHFVGVAYDMKYRARYRYAQILPYMRKLTKRLSRLKLKLR